MSFFFWAALKAFIPTTLFSAIFTVHGRHGSRLLLLIIASVALALSSRFLLDFNQQFHFYLSIATLLSWLIALIGLALHRPRLRFWLLLPLWLTSGLQFASNGALDEFSPTYVVNNTIILNTFAVGFAAAWLILLFRWLQALALRLQQQSSVEMKTAFYALFTILPLFYVLCEHSAQTLLAAIRLQWIDMSAPLLRFIAQASSLVSSVHFVTAGVLSLCAVLILVFAYRPRIKLAQQATTIVTRRLRKAAALEDLYSAIRFIVLAVTLAAGSWYWVAVASQPPRLTDATKVEMADDQFIHLTKEGLDDGNLHRFAWVSSSGRVVRFFVINRYPDRHALAVVFDACQLCGDDGYILRDNQLECISCGVHLFLPSVGQLGGCNPIPIDDWSETEHEVLVPQSGLEKGEMLFSTIVSIDVVDPVDGTVLNNKTAQWQYRFGTKHYYFSSEKNYQLFIDNPEHYVPNKYRAP